MPGREDSRRRWHLLPLVCFVEEAVCEPENDVGIGEGQVYVHTGEGD